jgi:catechol 2,3-dioxygenase-like lactoylglutathione lyase family enzyme
MITGIFPTICTDDIAATGEFYRTWFGFEDVFASDWYVQLQAPNGPHRQIGIVRRSHPSVPEGFRQLPAGFLLSIEVDNVDDVHRRLADAGVRMARDLRDEPWGQRHFIAIDPSGTMVDVITAIPPSSEYAEMYVAGTGA